MSIFCDLIFYRSNQKHFSWLLHLYQNNVAG